jgi:precorrin-6B methylase 2
MRLLEHLAPEPHDVFYDLGSGIGQVALHAALATRVASSIGIELLPARHESAQTALARAREIGLERARVCAFRRGDFLRTRLTEATLVYVCSTAFPFALMQQLTRKLANNRVGLVVATLSELDDTPWFRTETTLRLDTSWRRRTPVYIYRLVRRRTA